MQLSAWMKIATTDVARKHGRDVEFARSLRIPYIPSERQIIRVVFFDCPSRDVEKQRLIGTAEFPLVSVCSAKGLPVNFPLRFLAVTKRDVKRSSRIPDGTAVICADVVTDRESKFRLDVECNKIIKAKALKSAPVKRLFYTIHAIIDKEKKSDRWTLIYRSDSVEMINKKRDGGSLEYNYFSSRRLVAGHGVVIEDPDEASDKSPGKGVRSSGGLLERVGKTLGMRQNERFFSLPGADLTLQRVDTRLKLSLFEDNGSLGGFDLIADTAFTIADLKSRELGGSSAIKVHSNVMGKAVLKYVECSKDPRYFCLSLVMHNLR